MADFLPVKKNLSIYCRHLKIPVVVECPGAGKKLTLKCPGAGNIFCANARGCPGGMVRVGTEREILALAPDS